MKDQRKTKAQLILELQASRQSEEQYRQLVESANDAIVTFTLEGTVTSVNRGLEAMLGWSREELLGHHYRKFVTPASVMQGEERTRRFLLGDRLPSIFEAEMMHKGGRVVPVEARTRPIRDKDGNPVAIQGIYRDITARKQQTEELRRNREQLALIFDKVSDLIFLIEVEPGPRFRFIAANSSLLRAVGLSEEKVIGHVAEDFFCQEEAALVTANYTAALEAGRPLTYEEQRNLLTGQLSFETTLTPLIDEHGRCTHLLGTSHEITARKRAEEALQASEGRYRRLFENANDAIFSASQDGIITAVNRRLEVTTGWSRDELIGQHYGMLTTPAALAMLEERNRRALAREKLPSVFEVDIRHKDGSIVLVEAKARFIRDHETKPIGFQTIFRDIGERKRMEEALRESEERYRSLFENAYDGIGLLTAEGIITSANRGLEAMLGWSRAELIGQSYQKFHTPSSLAAEEERIRRFRAGERVSSISTIELVHRNGRVIPVEARTRFIRYQDGKPMGVLAILRDITERKRAEEALRQAEEKYHTLVDCMQDGVFIVQDGKVRFANEAFAKMLGYTVDDLTGTDLRELIAPEDAELVMERYRRRMAGEVVPQSYELRMLQKDQRTRIITELNVRLSTFQDQPATMGTVRNITLHKQAQEEKETLQEQLFQARKLEALGTLAGGVAHDFNNILSAIMGFTELATDEVREGTLARRNLEEVLKASRRAKALVQQILTFSRPSPQNRQPTQPQPILEEVLTSLRASLPPTIELRHHFDNTAGPVTISASQLQQILTNLCTNAIQALGSRGGVIEIHSQRINVERDLAFRVKNLSPGPYMTLTISDTGCGMPSTIQERIFEPFFTTRPVGEGNGLGLAIVHGIVTGHGGAITVDSTPGEGTTFVVYLPASTHEITSADMPHHSVPPAATTCGDGKGGLSGTTDFSH